MPKPKRPSRPAEPDPYLVDDENPEWTDEMFRQAKSADEVMPEFMAMWRARRQGERGPQKAPTKRQVTLRLDRDVLEHFQADGPGWQTRINAALKRMLAPRARRNVKSKG